MLLKFTIMRRYHVAKFNTKILLLGLSTALLYSLIYFVGVLQS